MLLTLTTTHTPATDLGYLLGKHPERVQHFSLNFGQAHVFYPEATPERCSAALLLDINPIGLVRREPGSEFALEQYVNDRPYVASSFLSVAIAQVYNYALGGKCKERPQLVETPLPLEAIISALPCRGGETLLQRLFEPLGYNLYTQRQPLDTAFPAWGESAYYTVTLQASKPLREVLTHLYVLMPVLDDDKHYYVGQDEVEKLLRFGEGWLKSHPERELITQRYLAHLRSLKRMALERLVDDRLDEQETRVIQQEAEIAITLDPQTVAAIHNEQSGDVPNETLPDHTPAAESTPEPSTLEPRLNLHDLRLHSVLTALKASGAKRVLDLGCGEGKLLALLLKDKQFSDILGMDVSHRALEMAADRLHLDRLPPKQRERIHLLQGSLTYRDARLYGFDAAAAVEVIEHLEPSRLAAFERVLFEFARPTTIVITTPNAEYNVLWPSLPAGKFRHNDHRFEWTRAEFQDWCEQIATRFGYRTQIKPIGPEDETVGAASQMAIFVRE